MSWHWPRTLFARLMLIWLLGMAIVLAVSIALFVGERDRFGRDVLFEGIAREIVSAVDVLERLAPEDRAPWIDELGRRRLRLALRPPPPEASVLGEDHPLARALRRALPERETRVLQLRRGPESVRHHIQHIASIRLADGSPLLVRLPGPAVAMAPPPHPARLFASLAALVGGVSLLTWLAVRLATRPLSRLAAAARALGEDPNRAPIAQRGPAEVVQAAAAFNQMQRRIQEHVAERTRILAAISHDLQTPITRLRLRAEQVEDEQLKSRIQSDLDAMQALVREGLDYARSLDGNTPRKPIDLNALTAALADDAADMGWQANIVGTTRTPFTGQVDALRRALWNLLENGVKFGQSVELALEETDTGFDIRIRDHGPGLAADELERVFEPFYRTEASRNRETGGTGLGLAIARNLIRAQGGEITLANHPGGGLEARVRLPRDTVAASG